MPFIQEFYLNNRLKGEDGIVTILTSLPTFICCILESTLDTRLRYNVAGKDCRLLFQQKTLY